MRNFLAVVFVGSAVAQEALSVESAVAPEAPEAPKAGLRFADDDTGCGLFRTCFECIPKGCSWMPKFGCVSGSATGGFGGLNVCNPFDLDWNTELSCPEINSCKTCAKQSGCVWASGECVYSRGSGCSKDILNCANNPLQCSDRSGSEDDGDDFNPDVTVSSTRETKSGKKGKKNPDYLEAILNYGVGTQLTANAGSNSLLQFLSLNKWDNTNDAKEGDIKQSIYCAPFDIYCTAAERDPYAERNLAAVNSVLGTFGFEPAKSEGTKYEFKDGNYQAPLSISESKKLKQEQQRQKQRPWQYQPQTFIQQPFMQQTQFNRPKQTQFKRPNNNWKRRKNNRPNRPVERQPGYSKPMRQRGMPTLTAISQPSNPISYPEATFLLNQGYQTPVPVRYITQRAPEPEPEPETPVRILGNAWFGGSDIDLGKLG